MCITHPSQVLVKDSSIEIPKVLCGLALCGYPTSSPLLSSGQGRNNLFHAIIAFLHHIKTKEKGLLGLVT